MECGYYDSDADGFECSGQFGCQEGGLHQGSGGIAKTVCQPGGCHRDFREGGLAEFEGEEGRCDEGGRRSHGERGPKSGWFVPEV